MPIKFHPVATQINTGNHVSLDQQKGTIIAGYLAVPGGHVSAIKAALRAIEAMAAARPACNQYFLSLRFKKSLSQILSNPNIWINYSPHLDTLDHAAQTYFYDNQDWAEIALAPSTCEGPTRIGKIMGTLLHEFAHVAGARGTIEKSAEISLFACGLGTKTEYNAQEDDPNTLYKPWVVG